MHRSSVLGPQRPARLLPHGLVRRGVALVIALTTALVTGAQVAPAGAVLASAEATSTTYIVSFVEGTPVADQAQVLAGAGVVDVAAVPVLRMHTVEVPTSGESGVVAELRSDPSVARVEADKTRAIEGTPDDPSYAEQWGLAQIGWDQAYGSVDPAGSAVVAVLDTGVNAGHPDLAGNLVPGTSVLDGSDGTSDGNGHGTAMAGIVAARTNNGAGVAGVGYAGVSVMPVAVLGSDGTGQDSDVIAGLVYAADHGADVALMAFSSTSYSPSLQAAIDYAWSKGVVLVAATGNDGSSTATFPAGDRGVIGVSNTTQDDSLNSSSNYGDDTFLGAPGTGIATTSADGGYVSVTGTSASAATVAGAAALLKANDSAASNSVVAGRLARNADVAGTVAQTGNGRLNLARALGDTATDPVKPSGAAPVGDSGPFVGPYVAAATSTISGVVKSSANALISGATVTVSCASPTCSTEAPTYAGGGSATNATGTYTSQPNFSPGNATPTVTMTAAAPGYASQTLTTFQISNGSTTPRTSRSHP